MARKRAKTIGQILGTYRKLLACEAIPLNSANAPFLSPVRIPRRQFSDVRRPSFPLGPNCFAAFVPTVEHLLRHQEQFAPSCLALGRCLLRLEEYETPTLEF